METGSRIIIKELGLLFLCEGMERKIVLFSSIGSP